MKLGRYRVVLRPLMYFIIGSAIIGAIAVPTMRYVIQSKAEAIPDYGYVKPSRWKFKTQGGAEATMVAAKGDSQKTLVKGQDVFLADMSEGVTIDIQRLGKSPDGAYLRNGLNLTEVTDRKDLRLHFYARSVASPHRLLVVIRDGKSLLWRQEFTVSGDWKEYSTVIPYAELAKAANTNLILAIQLGYSLGELSLRQIEVRK